MTSSRSNQRNQRSVGGSPARPSSIWLHLVLFVVAGLLPFTSKSQPVLLAPGFRPLPLGVHALVGGHVVVKPGQELSNATIVIRDGRFETVGTNLQIPPDARVWNVRGKTIYAGFIESCFAPDSAAAPVSTSEAFPVNEASFAAGGTRFYGAPGVQSESSFDAQLSGGRFTPEKRVANDYVPKNDQLAPMRDLGFTTAVLVPAKGIARGRSALVSLLEDAPARVVLKPEVFQHIAFDTSDNDTGTYPVSLMGVIASLRQLFLDARFHARPHSDAKRRSEFHPGLRALAPVLDRQIKVAFEPGSALMNERAARFAAEFNLDFCIIASGEEWRRPDRIAATARTFIVPVNFPSAPKLPSDDDWEQVSLEQLRAWDWAPENPALLRQHDCEVALTTYGLSDRKSFRKNLQLALDRGFSETDALAALTTVPAKLCGMDDQLGTIEAGKIANLVIVNGRYFDPETKVASVWIDGRVFPIDRAEAATPEPARPAADPDSSAAPPKEEPEEHPKPPGAAELSITSTNTPESTPEAKPAGKQNAARELLKNRAARSPLDGRGALTNPPSVLVRGATIWTCGPEGILTNASLLVTGGRIERVGQFAMNPTSRSLVIEASGLHVTPGIVDCHSHAAILGNANETGLPSSAMVRISDVVNSESENLYRQLAGGVTTINLLHGSANPIGGQNCVIKLRDGAPPDELIFSNAPPGIKFALGENVKQANWGDRFNTRFPQTRMGIRAFIQNRFVAAQTYRAARASGSVAPDLELEAIAEILEGNRWIHCHAYRQDEMLMLTRLMQEFGVQIGTFQHALEAYKIADELAAADIGVSLFSDWWGFKFELFDSIPYNGTLSRHRGVLVSFNSDFSELARRLYLEAAKAVKYGGTPEVEALKFITLNPAKQLRIDRFVGSLEAGKDADFAIWSRSPLDAQTVCLQTWIDGAKYFDRAEDAKRMGQLQAERASLIAKAKQAANPAGGGEAGPGGGKSFFHTALEHQHQHDWRCEGE